MEEGEVIGGGGFEEEVYGCFEEEEEVHVGPGIVDRGNDDTSTLKVSFRYER